MRISFLISIGIAIVFCSSKSIKDSAHQSLEHQKSFILISSSFTQKLKEKYPYCKDEFFSIDSSEKLLINVEQAKKVFPTAHDPQACLFRLCNMQDEKNIDNCFAAIECVDALKDLVIWDEGGFAKETTVAANYLITKYQLAHYLYKNKIDETKKLTPLPMLSDDNVQDAEYIELNSLLNNSRHESIPHNLRPYIPLLEKYCYSIQNLVINKKLSDAILQEEKRGLCCPSAQVKLNLSNCSLYHIYGLHQLPLSSEEKLSVKIIDVSGNNFQEICCQDFYEQFPNTEVIRINNNRSVVHSIDFYGVKAGDLVEMLGWQQNPKLQLRNFYTAPIIKVDMRESLAQEVWQEMQCKLHEMHLQRKTWKTIAHTIWRSVRRPLGFSLGAALFCPSTWIAVIPNAPHGLLLIPSIGVSFIGGCTVVLTQNFFERYATPNKSGQTRSSHDIIV